MFISYVSPPSHCSHWGLLIGFFQTSGWSRYSTVCQKLAAASNHAVMYKGPAKNRIASTSWLRTSHYRTGPQSLPLYEIMLPVNNSTAWLTSPFLMIMKPESPKFDANSFLLASMTTEAVEEPAVGHTFTELFHIYNIEL